MRMRGRVTRLACGVWSVAEYDVAQGHSDESGGARLLRRWMKIKGGRPLRNRPPRSQLLDSSDAEGQKVRRGCRAGPRRGP